MLDFCTECLAAYAQNRYTIFYFNPHGIYIS